MPSGHIPPSKTFAAAVAQIDSANLTQAAPKPVVAPMATEIDREVKEKETEVQEPDTPVVASDVVSAESGTSTSSWQDRIEAAKKKKREQESEEE